MNSGMERALFSFRVPDVSGVSVFFRQLKNDAVERLFFHGIRDAHTDMNEEE